MDESEALRKDIAGYLKKTLGFAFCGILVIGLIDFGIQRLSSKLSSSDEALDQRIERALAKRVTIAVGPVPTTAFTASSAPAPLIVPAVSWPPSPSSSVPPPGTAPPDTGIQTQP